MNGIRYCYKCGKMMEATTTGFTCSCGHVELLSKFLKPQTVQPIVRDVFEDEKNRADKAEQELIEVKALLKLAIDDLFEMNHELALYHDSYFYLTTREADRTEIRSILEKKIKESSNE